MAQKRTHVAVGVAVLLTAFSAWPSGAATPADTSSPVGVGRDADGRVRQVVPARSTPGGDFAGLVADRFEVPRDQLRVEADRGTPAGRTVRLRQVVHGVPVFGGEVSELLNVHGELISAQGKLTSTTVGSFPAGTQAAERASRAAAATAARASARVVKTEPFWYDATLAGEPGTPGRAVPVYRVQLRGEDDEDNWVVLVSAESGSVVKSWSSTNHALNRVVCDADRAIVSETAANTAVRCGTTFAASRVEGGAASSQADVNAVYTYFGDTAGFYRDRIGTDLTNLIGADYGDGRGKALRGTVRLCQRGSSTQCPWTNAYWNGEQMAFGEGVTTDDVTGHELTHGVTEKLNGLEYLNESGAINEALSDIFGEFVDLGNGSSDDTPANRWKIGEGSSLGVIRDMKTPTAYGQPDRKGSSYWYTGSADSGGVHINSGVGNHVAQLIADGGSFNGQTVAGLGITKSALLWFGVETALTSTAKYADLARTLSSVCAQYVSSGSGGFTSADCTNVGKAATATELSR